jgi:hypothetical protein
VRDRERERERERERVEKFEETFEIRTEKWKARGSGRLNGGDLD